MKTRLFSSGFLLSSLVFATASPLWQLDLSEMELNQTPQVQAATAGTVNTQPQAVTDTTANVNSFIHVVNDFGAHGLTLAGRSILFQKAALGAQEVGFLGAIEDYTTWNDYELTFDLLVGTGISGQPLNVRMTTNSANTSVAALTFDMNGTLLLSSSFNATTLSITNGWNPTGINQIKLQIDSQQQKALAIVNGIFVGELALDLADPETNPLGVGRIRFRSNSNNQLHTGGFAVNNLTTSLTLSPIPEPGTVSLLMMGTLAGIGLWRKKIRKGR